MRIRFHFTTLCYAEHCLFVSFSSAVKLEVCHQATVHQGARPTGHTALKWSGVGGQVCPRFAGRVTECLLGKKVAA